MSHRSRYGMDSHRRYSGTIIKFKRKGGFRSGISLGEAMANVRLSGNDSYTYSDFAVDGRGRIMLKIRVSSIVDTMHALRCLTTTIFLAVVRLYVDDL